MIQTARTSRAPVLVASTTIIEATAPTTNLTALSWALSQVRVVPVTDEIARRASLLLKESRLSGHAHALDAVVAAIALAQPTRPAILTSDPGDLRRLVDGRAAVVPLT